MAYTKIPVAPGDVISSAWGNHIQTQYEEAKADLDNHANDDVRHITAAERSNWNAKETPAGAQAKADAARDAAIDWVRERGIGSPGQTIDDLNNATEPGRWYVAGSSTANTPDGLSWWTVLVAYRNSSNLAQIAFRSISGATQTKIRFLSGGTWTEWGDIWTSFNLPSPARTNVENHFTSAQRIQNLLRFAATSESGIIQAGENSNDTNARLRIARSNTTSSPISSMEIFSNEVKINGNDVWHGGNNPVNFGSTRGYQRLASGLIIQFGASSPPSVGEYEHTFPIAFPNSVFSVIATPLRRRNIDDFPMISVVDPTNTRFKTDMRYLNGAIEPVALYWIAIGY